MVVKWPETKDCGACGKQYEARNASAKWCSAKCRQKNARQAEGKRVAARAACRLSPAKDCHVATAAMQERHGMNQMDQIETGWSTEAQHVRLPNLGRL